MSSENPNPNQELAIDLPEDVAEGSYANLAIIGHSPTEFVFDFVSVLPGMPKGKVRSRVIMAPAHAKRLLAALNENIQKYEQMFGRIEDPGQTTVEFPMQFNGPAGQA